MHLLHHTRSIKIVQNLVLIDLQDHSWHVGLFTAELEDMFSRLRTSPRCILQCHVLYASSFWSLPLTIGLHKLTIRCQSAGVHADLWYCLWHWCYPHGCSPGNWHADCWPNLPWRGCGICHSGTGEVCCRPISALSALDLFVIHSGHCLSHARSCSGLQV